MSWDRVNLSVRERPWLNFYRDSYIDTGDGESFHIWSYLSTWGIEDGDFGLERMEEDSFCFQVHRELVEVILDARF